MDSSLHPGWVRPAPPQAGFDFIYAAGFYDYLDDAGGRRLLRALARMIQPGGRILIANLLPGASGACYLEAAMDWWLVFRQPEELLSLAEDLPASVSRQVFRDSLDHLAYLELEFEDPSVV
jgi:hypothetical protein